MWSFSFLKKKNKMVVFEKITTLEQCEELKKLATRISREHFGPITGVEQVDYMMEKFMSPSVVMKEISENYLFEFILYENKRVGFYAIATEGDHMFLSKLYVEKEYRGKGLATAAFNKIKGLSKGLKYIYLTCNKNNESSIAVYKHLGFYIDHAAVTDIGGGFVMDDYILKYDL